LTLKYQHRDYGSGHLVIDEQTLLPVDAKVDVPSDYPQVLDRVESEFPGMGMRRSSDLGQSAEPGVRFILQWESLGSNHDRPRSPPLPSPSRLRVIKLQ
jgi:hypothetical protein